MARPLRIEFPGALYHVTSRGDRREAIFEDDEDRLLFLHTLAEVIERFNWLCHAYCLMTNHYHLLVETPDGNLSKGMRHLKGSNGVSSGEQWGQFWGARSNGVSSRIARSNARQWGQFSHCNNPESGVGSNPWQDPFALNFPAPSIM